MSLTQHNTPQRIGIIAGIGLYPVELAKLLKNKNYEIYCAAIRDHALPEIAKYCVEYQPMGLGQFGKAIRFFKKHNITSVTMAGGVKKRLLFSADFLWKHFPDFYTARIFSQHILSKQKSQGNDSLLMRCVEAFELQGIHITAATDYAPELIMKQTTLTKRRPSSSEWKDIQYGWKVAREIGRLDIGQSVAVKNQSIIAVEALEGTDGCISRAGSLCPSGGFTIIKIGKPNQDMRFDVPYFGVETLKNLVASGACVLAMEAGKTVTVEAQECADFADKNDLCVVFVEDGTAQMAD
ncbi:DUF1009 family protein [Ereboglobus sp. PH5-10]|uniref:UDP-2,3-diacylglucosamine pyrophosphatase n=1 Tax=Ereboglobus luteus TaxID=1796921 RepID=A0A2U8E485_9BACT|nr:MULTISPECIES: UDP-2,3-diacylglucosamine diphosphatase LpxI [Ereboglobus]AWI09651.1 hypothetical protein CKA38_10675 [Ereboglobus luteus]MDF9828073.1 DUF1009 family protein [Ereboglobus sp. PH5-10]